MRPFDSWNSDAERVCLAVLSPGTTWQPAHAGPDDETLRSQAVVSQLPGEEPEELRRRLEARLAVLAARHAIVDCAVLMINSGDPDIAAETEELAATLAGSLSPDGQLILVTYLDAPESLRLSLFELFDAMAIRLQHSTVGITVRFIANSEPRSGVWCRPPLPTSLDEAELDVG